MSDGATAHRHVLVAAQVGLRHLHPALGRLILFRVPPELQYADRQFVKQLLPCMLNNKLDAALGSLYLSCRQLVVFAEDLR